MVFAAPYVEGTGFSTGALTQQALEIASSPGAGAGSRRDEITGPSPENRAPHRDRSRCGHAAATTVPVGRSEIDRVLDLAALGPSRRGDYAWHMYFNKANQHSSTGLRP
jgi:hypothetical protein